jgi:Holliday junction resolvase RusA-like endonuclease
MGKTFDFQFVIQELIPATQEAFQSDGFDQKIRKQESEAIKAFRGTLSKVLDEELKSNKQFPSKKGIFVFVLQHFASQREYESRDVDNMAKTILDLLRGRFYDDDKQVLTLLISKRIDKRIPDNLAYCAIKETSPEHDVEPVKICNVENAVRLYVEAKRRQSQAT